MSEDIVNVMRKPRIEKVVVNIGVGESGERLQKAQKVIEMVTGQKSKQTISKVTNRDFGIREGQPIGCIVTLRGETAIEFLKRAFTIRENRIASYSFDREGNLSFGIPDYTDFSGMKYDPEIGIFGMDISVSIQRPGKRVSRRRVMRRPIPMGHRMTRVEAMNFVKEMFNVEVID
ncbi:MAG: 50S ribosomal protein L5 [Methanomassiliicoccales archaeon]|nr:50S ribosomal protein L5 [Methanomassiliicoccales archaeon]